MSFSSRFDPTETESRLYPILAGKKIPKPKPIPTANPAFPLPARQKAPLFPPVVSNYQNAFTTRSILERQTIPIADFRQTFLQQSLFNTISHPTPNQANTNRMLSRCQSPYFANRKQRFLTNPKQPITHYNSPQNRKDSPHFSTKKTKKVHKKATKLALRFLRLKITQRRNPFLSLSLNSAI